MPTREELLAEARRRGLSVPEANTPSREDLLAEAKRRGLQVPQAEEPGMLSQAWSAVKGAVQGNAEYENAGDFSGYIEELAENGHYGDIGFGGNPQVYKDIMRMSDVGVTGNVDDMARALKEINPEADIRKDKNGNLYVQGDKPYYFNPPGLGGEDLLNVTGQGIMYSPALKAGGMAASTMGKAVATGAGTAATNAGMQKMAGRDEIDAGEVAVSGLLGGGTEIISPYAGRLYGWAKSKLTGSAKHINTGQQLAQKAGAELDDDAVEMLGKMRNSVDSSVPDEAIIAELQHGLKLTRGQATGSIKQQSAEQQLRQQPVIMDKFKQVDDFNAGQVEDNIKNIRSNLYGGVGDDFQQAATAEVGLEGLKSAASQAKQAYRSAYDDVGSLFVKNEAADGLTDRLSRAVSTQGQRLSERATPKAMEALEIVQEGIDKLTPGTKGFSMKAFDDQRKLINSLYSKNMDGADKRALTIVKNELDNWFYSSVDDSLLKGNPEQLKQLEKARGMMADYMNRFQSKESSKKVVADILNKDVTPEEFTNMIVGVNGYSKASAANAVKAFKDAVGEGSEAFQALQANVLEKLVVGGVDPKTGRAVLKGYEGLVGTFNEAFNKKGASMMKALFDNKTANEIKSLMRSVGRLITPQEVKNASGSGRFMAQFMNQHGNKFPIISNLWNGAKSVANYSNATTMPLRVDNQLRNAGGLVQGVNSN